MSATTGPGTPERDITAVHELSPMQLGMLYHALEAEAERMYTVLLGYRIEGPLEVEPFVRAWQRAVANHEILRTAFVWERVQRPRQVVLRHVETPVEFSDCSDLAPAERERVLAERYARERDAGFELAKPPLMRLALVRLGERTHEFVWSLHHIVLDGWSMTRLLTEVFEDYLALRDGRRPPDRTPLPYGAYVGWLARQDAGAGEAYWRRALDGLPQAPPLGVAVDERGAAQGGSGQLDRDVPPDVAARLQDAGAASGVTFGTLVHAAWALQLARATLRPEVTFGSVVWGRPHDLPGAEGIVGPCMNTLPVRVRVPPGERLGAWVSALHAELLAGREHGHVPLARIRSLAHLPPGRPLFESVVAFQRFAGGDRLASGVDALRVRETVSAQFVNFPLALEVGAHDGAQLRLLYDPARFPDPAPEQVLGELLTTLRRLPDQLGGPVRAAVVRGGAAADRPAGVRATLPLLVEEVDLRARLSPGAPAVVEGGRASSYRDLDRAAAEVASWLGSRGVGRGDLVGVVVPRGLDLVAAQLGTLRAGAAFLPLDPDDAPGRLGAMLARAGARAVTTTAALATALPPVAPHLLVTGAGRRALDSAAPVAVSGHDLAYGIHTSGSTGEPKCVGVEHAGLANLAAWTRERFGLVPTDRCGLLCNPAFDGSVWEIWPCLSAGGSLHVVPPGVRLDPPALRDWLLADGITVTFVPTALLTSLLDLAWPARAPLRSVLTGGEALPRRPRAGLPFELVNNYGVAEAAVVQTSATVPPEGGVTQPPGIGRPIPGMRAVVLDRQGRDVAGGAVGELCVGGAGVARGYLGRPDATAERFVPDPDPERPGERLYRTGDLARRLADGSFEYAGRVDDQVQVRGYRVEVGEVEAVLTGHPRVASAVVLGRRERAGAPVELEAHVVGVGGATDTADVHRYLAQRLPAHMVPSRLAFLDALPMTPNGKVDRAALPPAPRARTGEARRYVEPRTAAERALCGICEGVLGVERVGVHDDLLELGCDSILTIQIASRAAQAGLGVSVRDVLAKHTVAALAAGAGEGGHAPDPAGAGESCLWPLRAVPGVPLFVVHPISGRAGCYAALAAHLGEDQPVYGLQEPDGPGEAPRTIEGMAERYVEAIMAVHRDGPYLLAGWSFGGLVASAMAARLHAGGHDVALLALIDTPAPSVARDLPDYDPRRAARLVERELRVRTAGGVDLAGGAEAWARSVEGDYRRRIEAARRYQPLRCPVAPVVLRASEPAGGHRALPRRVRRRLSDPAFGWDRLEPGPAEIHTLPGSHDALLSEPGVGALATILRTHVERATAPARGPTTTVSNHDPGGSQMAAITFDAVTKRYGETVALDGLSLEIPRGEIVAVLGPNGAGKTTAVSLMVGLRAPTSGSVRVLGADPRDRDVRSLCGIMLQDARLPESLRARELVDLFRSYYPDPLDTATALDLAGLTEQAGEFAGRLSGGQRQRLQYALAICGRPRLLFLDEPTVGMDVEARRAFLAEVTRYAESGATIVLTTHYLDEADQLAGRVVVIDRGRVIADASPSALKATVGSRQVSFDWEGDRPPALEHVAVSGATAGGGRAVLLSNTPDRVVASLVAAGHELANLEVRGADLEDAFVALTSRAQEQEVVR
jgi:amino acid adenylation domain-containing protein